METSFEWDDELGAPYQRMIRNLLRKYVEQQRELEKQLSLRRSDGESLAIVTPDGSVRRHV